MTLKPWGEVKRNDRVRIEHGHHLEGVIFGLIGTYAGKRMVLMIVDGDERGIPRVVSYAAHRSVEVVE